MRRLGRYLLGKTPSPELQARYAEALRTIEGARPARSAALETVRAKPWTLPYLDAACGFFRPDDPLRKRLLLAAAILEATPDHADDFLPRRHSRAMLLALLAWNGLRAALKLAVGVVLLRVFCPLPRTDRFTPSPREGRR